MSDSALFNENTSTLLLTPKLRRRLNLPKNGRLTQSFLNLMTQVWIAVRYRLARETGDEAGRFSQLLQNHLRHVDSGTLTEDQALADILDRINSLLHGDGMALYSYLMRIAPDNTTRFPRQVMSKNTSSVDMPVGVVLDNEIATSGRASQAIVRARDLISRENAPGNSVFTLPTSSAPIDPNFMARSQMAPPGIPSSLAAVRHLLPGGAVRVEALHDGERVARMISGPHAGVVYGTRPFRIVSGHEFLRGHEFLSLPSTQALQRPELGQRGVSQSAVQDVDSYGMQALQRPERGQRGVSNAQSALQDVDSYGMQNIQSQVQLPTHGNQVSSSGYTPQDYSLSMNMQNVSATNSVAVEGLQTCTNVQGLSPQAASVVQRRRQETVAVPVPTHGNQISSSGYSLQDYSLSTNMQNVSATNSVAVEGLRTCTNVQGLSSQATSAVPREQQETVAVPVTPAAMLSAIESTPGMRDLHAPASVQSGTIAPADMFIPGTPQHTTADRVRMTGKSNTRTVGAERHGQSSVRAIPSAVVEPLSRQARHEAVASIRASRRERHAPIQASRRARHGAAAPIQSSALAAPSIQTNAGMRCDGRSGAPPQLIVWVPGSASLNTTETTYIMDVPQLASRSAGSVVQPRLTRGSQQAHVIAAGTQVHGNFQQERRGFNNPFMSVADYDAIDQPFVPPPPYVPRTTSTAGPVVPPIAGVARRGHHTESDDIRSPPPSYDQVISSDQQVTQSTYGGQSQNGSNRLRDMNQYHNYPRQILPTPYRPTTRRGLVPGPLQYLHNANWEATTTFATTFAANRGVAQAGSSQVSMNAPPANVSTWSGTQDGVLQGTSVSELTQATFPANQGVAQAGSSQVSTNVPTANIGTWSGTQDGVLRVIDQNTTSANVQGLKYDQGGSGAM